MERTLRGPGRQTESRKVLTDLLESGECNGWWRASRSRSLKKLWPGSVVVSLVSGCDRAINLGLLRTERVGIGRRSL